MLYKVHLMHSNQACSSNQRSTLKKSETISMDNNWFTMVIFFKVYIKHLKKKKTSRDHIV